ncbi:DUF3856 domain-containing protein (plasmid) [Phormidium sp. CLA17]|uniref:CHAT domain-containing protein n=1 Tax=Leptolyngbya sp. Cla-17 TaxID=2803751 RepID=UPI0019316616|nr:DUF3856 domain-containing protein [Leptolyngbya sp. Cla-17]MBM0745673.1 DUF3856 domain-containing protein [Leptolyngbya sp. Cla-17]
MSPYLIRLNSLTAALLLAAVVPCPMLLVQRPVVAQTNPDRKTEADRLLQQGRQQLQTSQYEAAQQSCQQALEIYRALKDRNGEAKALNNLGIAYSSLSQYDQAITYYQQALPLFQQVKDRNGEAKALTNLGIAYRSLSQYDQAITYYQQALPLFQQVKDRNGEARALNNLGLAYWSLSQYDQAITYYQQALPLFQQVKDRNGEANALMNLGGAYRSLSQYDQAITYYQQALPLFQQVKDRNGEAKALNNLGIAYSSLSQYDQAITYYQQALPLFQQVKDRNGEAQALNNLGIAYRSLSQYDQAITYYQQALPLFQQVKDRNGEAKALANLGGAYWLLSQYDKAITYYQQALPIYQQVKDRNGEAIALNNLGGAYRSLSQYDKAITYYQQALPLFQQVKDRNGEANALSNLGNAYWSLSQYDKAITYYQQALPLFQQVKDRNGEGSLLSDIGNLLATQKQPELAIVFYKQSVNVRESIRAGIRSLSHDLQASYTESVADTYRRLADLLLSEGRVLEAQQVLELLKIQELRDYTRDTRAGGKTQGSPLTPPEAAVVPPYNSVITVGLKLSECEQQKPYCLERDQLLAQRNTANTAFNQQVDNLRALAKQQQGRDPAQLQREELTVAAQNVVKAQPKTVLIYPLVLEDKLWLVWGTQAGKQGVVFASKEVTVSRKKLAEKAVEFRTLLEKPGDVKQLQQVSSQLYQWLVEPLRAELDANGIQNLVFSLDRSTRYIPMAALFDGKQYLVDRFTVSTILTAGLTNTQDKLSSKIDDDPVLALGLSEKVPNFNALPNVLDELNGIVRSGNTGIYPGLKLLNKEFTTEAFKKLIDHRIVHIATHGQFVPGKPEDSFLVLGNGQPLKIPQIETMTDLGGIHLVVLSACETAKGGADKEGIEVSGISYYFLSSGAKSVIASLWLVNDTSTSQLMQQFYKNLATGMSKAEALRQAQQFLLQVGSNGTKQTRGDSFKLPTTDGSKPITRDFSHPYYWAPFILIGNNL